MKWVVSIVFYILQVGAATSPDPDWGQTCWMKDGVSDWFGHPLPGCSDDLPDLEVLLGSGDRGSQ